jgi:hypothetical protein
VEFGRTFAQDPAFEQPPPIENFPRGVHQWRLAVTGEALVIRHVRNRVSAKTIRR